MTVFQDLKNVLSAKNIKLHDEMKNEGTQEILYKSIDFYKSQYGAYFEGVT